MTIAYVNQTTLNNGVGISTGLVYQIPTGGGTGDLLLAVAAWKPHDVTIASGTVLSDYALLTNHASGTDANVLDDGSTRMHVRYRIHDGAETDPTGTLSAAPSPRMSTVSRWSKTSGTWDVIAADAPDVNKSGTSLSLVADTPMDIKAGDMVLVIMAGGGDHSLSGPTMSIPGCTLSALNLINNTNTTTQGNDGWIRFYNATVTAGTATGVPTFTGTIGTTDRSDASAVFIRMREVTDLGASDSITITDSAAGVVNGKTAVFELWESGSLVVNLGPRAFSGSQVYELDISPFIPLLADPTGANIELRVSSTESIQIDAVEWQSTHTPTLSLNENRTAADSVTLSDTMSATGTRTRASSDTVTLTDVSVAAGSRPRLIPDTVTLIDAATRAVGRARTSSDSLSVTDAATRTSARTRTVADTITTSDVAARTVGRTRTASDTLTTTDAATRTSARTRAATDTLSVSEAVTGVRGVGRTAADSLTVTDTAAATGNNRVRTASDSLTLTDAATRTSARSRAASDSLTLTDAATKTVGRPRAATDSVGLSDVATRVVARSKAAADSVTLSDTATRGSVGRARAAADSLSLTDAATRTGFRNRTAADSVTFTDVADPGGGVKRADDSITLSDSASPRGNRARTASDSVTLGDSTARSRTSTRAVSDSISAADTASPRVGLLRAATDSLYVTDAAGVVRSTSRSALDVLSVSDAATTITLVPRAVSDSVFLTDSAGTAQQYTRNIADTVAVGDSAVALARKANPGTGWGMRI
jgi:hypothetical protein